MILEIPVNPPPPPIIRISDIDMGSLNRIILTRLPVLRGLFCHVMTASVLLTTLVGCGETHIEPGSEQDVTLVVVVSDLYLEEARYQLRKTSAEFVDLSVEALGASLPAARRDSILGQHSFTESSFTAAMQPYLSDPEQLQTFYNRVLDHLIEQRQKLQDP